jgi:hypothetical protein
LFPALLVAAGALLVAGGPARGLSEPRPVATVLPIQNRAGDQGVGAAVEQALRKELSRHAELVDPGRTRAALRRLRIRDGDAAPPELLPRLAEELGADWLVVPTLHDAERRGLPRITVSARIYAGAGGELLWSGYQGGSGLDSEKLLGLGVVRNVELLAPRVVERMTADLWQALGRSDTPRRNDEDKQVAIARNAGRVAIVPLDSITEDRRTANAETVTEAARAVLFRHAFRLVEPGCTGEVLRRTQAGIWGGVVPESRAALRQVCGADLIVTGVVEAYGVKGGQGSPDPQVAVALRVLDPVSGRILWMGALERSGQDMAGLFRVGREYSRGALAERLTERLIRRLLDDWPRQVARREEN